MKISVITVSFNSASTIKETIESVLSQDYPQLEYIIIDGGSTDSTMTIVNSYKERIFRVVSTADGGIYDAMNKGIDLANGDVVAIINSDDCYYSNHTLSSVADLFKKTDVDAVYGDIVYVDRHFTGKVTRSWQSGPYVSKKVFNGWIPPHPAFFVKRQIYSKLGKFNLNFKIAADYELMLRLIEKHKIKLAYLPEIAVRMRTGGHSGRNFGQRYLGWRELRLAWAVNNMILPKFFILRRILYKLGQFLIV